MRTTPERSFCDALRHCLLSFSDHGVTPEVLDSYLTPKRLESLPDLYWRLICSAQNRGMRSTVISGSMTGGLTALAPVLIDFDPHAVADKYGNDSEAILEAIVTLIKPRGKVRRGNRCSWPQFCMSIVSSAQFLTQFRNAEEFYAWADCYESDSATRFDLPAVVARRIKGYGDALACDFLKEAGYVNYAKPDTHIRQILIGLGLISPRATDRQAVVAMATFSEAAGLTPYHVDKLMWLLGSGNFYRHPAVRSIATRRDDFIASQSGLFSGA